jgi:amylosucrase
VPGTREHRIFDGLRAIVAARRASPELHAAIPVEIIDAGDPRVFAFRRGRPASPLLALHNMSAVPVRVDGTIVRGQIGPAVVDRLRPARRDRAGEILLTAYESAWLVPRG